MKQHIAIDLIVLFNYYFILLKEITNKLRPQATRGGGEGGGGGGVTTTTTNSSSSRNNNNNNNNNNRSCCSCSDCCYYQLTSTSTTTITTSTDKVVEILNDTRSCSLFYLTALTKRNDQEKDGLINLHTHPNHFFYLNYLRHLIQASHWVILVGLLLIGPLSSVHNHNKYNTSTQNTHKHVFAFIY
jgi:hypothetical protein